jgi:hypothetical protein
MPESVEYAPMNVYSSVMLWHYKESNALLEHQTLDDSPDTNLFHDMISGRSFTGFLHLLNKTPIDWFSKLQSTVETATFGSEYIASQTATEQIMDLCNTL